MSALAREEEYFAIQPQPSNDERPPKVTPEEAAYLLGRGPFVARLHAKEKLLDYTKNTFVSGDTLGPNLPEYVVSDLKTEVRIARRALREFDAQYAHVTHDVASVVRLSDEPVYEPAQPQLTPSADMFNLYLQDIGRSSRLLTKEEEIELAKTIEAGLFAEKILSGAIDTSSDVTDEELEWLVAEGERAKERFVQSNLRLTVSIARRYGRAATGSMQLDDMVQEGNQGLIHAVEKFDYKKGFKFSTYSTWWIKQAVHRGIDNQARPVRIPTHRNELIRKINSFQTGFFNTNDREPTLEEMLVAFPDMTKEKLQGLIDDGRDVVYLDTPVGPEGDVTLGDLLQGSVPGPDSIVAEEGMRTYVEQFIETSITGKNAANEKHIIRSRFGLCGNRKPTYKELGEEVGLSAARVCQLERSALAQLRTAADRLGGRESFPIGQ